MIVTLLARNRKHYLVEIEDKNEIIEEKETVSNHEEKNTNEEKNVKSKKVLQWNI